MSLPTTLTAWPQWVAADAAKVPRNPTTGANASPTDPRTWGTFAQAERFAARHGLARGFVLTREAGITCIDLDHCRDPETGTIAPWAMTIIERIASYAEISVSGTGVHIYARGTLPPGGRRRGRVEMYDRGRYVIVTGQSLPGYETIEERTETLAELHRETFPPPPAPPITPLAMSLHQGDAEVLERARSFLKFSPLYDAGDLGDVGGDHSAGDLTVCNLIVRAGADRADQVDRIFRGSALFRDKWDERRGTTTYGAMTIARALDGTVVPFRPAAPPPTKTASCGFPPGDPELPDDVPGLKAVVADLTARLEAAEQRADRAERRAEMLSAVQSKTTRIIRNKQLGQERMTAVALTYAFANREAAGDAGDGGLYPITLGRIAEAAGVSEDAAGRHVKTLAEAGVLRKELRWMPERIDTETGEIFPGHKRQFIGPPSNVIDFVDAIATLAPEKPKNWGGTRTACPDHPDAGTVKRWSLHCAECDRLLDRGEEHSAPGAGPQDAVFVGTDPATLLPPVVNHYRYRKMRIDNNDDAPPDGFAAAWLQGQPIPSLDRHPDPAGDAGADRWAG
jgi:DNA-binding transcriptional ArsR family regulator